MLRPFVSLARVAVVLGLVSSIGCSLILGLEEATPKGSGGSSSSSPTGGASCDPKDKCPVPDTACLTATCEGEDTCGTENSPPGTACSDNGGTVCDGNGTCGSCGNPMTDCPPTTSECVLAICNGGACAIALLADGTKTPDGQAPGDCKQQVCDGAGATKIVDDDADADDDDNDCTVDTCSAGSNMHAGAAQGTPCAQAGGKVCGGGTKAGTCVECAADADCTSPSDPVCDTKNDNFVCVPAGCTDGTHNGNETGVDCGGPSCGKCGNGQPCSGNVDCVSDLCNAGMCAGCANDSECPASKYCNAGTCAPDKPDGAPCGGANDCVSDFCSDGFCCNVGCGGVCEACSGAKKGAGADGVCGSIAANFDPDAECGGAECNGAGACQLAVGTACTQGSQCAGGHCVEGVCCANACNGLCYSCSSNKTGATDGLCAPINPATDPDNECPGSACDGFGACQLAKGDPCSAMEECATGFCVDGYCCESDCGTICMSCDGNNTNSGNGNCGPVFDGTDPDNECLASSCFMGICM